MDGNAVIILELRTNYGYGTEALRSAIRHEPGRENEPGVYPGPGQDFLAVSVVLGLSFNSYVNSILPNW